MCLSLTQNVLHTWSQFPHSTVSNSGTKVYSIYIAHQCSPAPIVGHVHDYMVSIVTVMLVNKAWEGFKSGHVASCDPTVFLASQPAS